MDNWQWIVSQRCRSSFQKCFPLKLTSETYLVEYSILCLGLLKVKCLWLEIILSVSWVLVSRSREEFLQQQFNWMITMRRSCWHRLRGTIVSYIQNMAICTLGETTLMVSWALVIFKREIFHSISMNNCNWRRIRLLYRYR